MNYIGSVMCMNKKVEQYMKERGYAYTTRQDVQTKLKTLLETHKIKNIDEIEGLDLAEGTKAHCRHAYRIYLEAQLAD